MALQDRVISRLVALSLLLLLCTTRCEARAMGRLQSKSSNPLLNALFKLNFTRRVEPAHLPPPATGDADAASLAAADGSNSPFCVNPPDAPPSTTTPPFTSTPSTPTIPDQPPPLPSITPVPPSFEPSPPVSGAPGGQGPGDQGPPESGPGSGSGGPFLPPIVYPPPLAPPQQPGAGQPLWCVAKPTVPDPIIQEAMDYACGSGAECGSVQPSGACYQPNTVLAHASFAFNSYWQQTRAAGGTCDFGGTATIVTRDPSYEKCKFDLL